MPKKEEKKEKFAVIRSGNKQYKVKKGDIISLDRISKKNKPRSKGEVVEFEALLLADKGNLKIGHPLISGKKIKGRIIEDYKDKKIAVVKFKPKKRYTRKRGYRASKTKVEITTI